MFLVVAFFLIYGVEVYFRVRGAFAQSQCTVNQRQLHLSRLGLVIQAILQLITALFLLSDVLKEFWRDKLPVISQNIYDIGFRIIEFGVSLWFPCVLWNCCRPEELWVLNPKNIFQSFKHERDFEREPVNSKRNQQKNYNTIDQSPSVDTSQNFLCWICYDPDNHKAGPLIQACNCKGDMSAVHHECLRKWLVESATTAEDAKCRVCLQKYSLQESHYWLPKGTKFRHWILVSSILVAMIACPFGAYAVAHELTKTYVQVLAFGFTAIFELFCIKVLTVNAIKMYKRGRLSSVSIIGRRLILPFDGNEKKWILGDRKQDAALLRAGMFCKEFFQYKANTQKPQFWCSQIQNSYLCIKQVVKRRQQSLLDIRLCQNIFP